jgi:thymidylate synthase
MSLKLIHPEYQYINLIQKIITSNSQKTGRNGNTLSIFGEQMRFSLKEQIVPFITTKRLAWKTCLKELLWFINGSTSNKILKEQNVKIWNDNGSREFLDSRGLQHRDVDDLGPVYGFQWRNFNGTYTSHDNYEKNGVDQLQNVIDALKNTDLNNGKENRYSRRLVVSAWNPCQLDEMALPPCHMFFQFYVNGNDELSCSLYQRSGDIGLGVPFNIASYSLFTHLIAHHCGLKVGEFVHIIGDCHIYENHIEPLKQQITREPYQFPTIEILGNPKNNINDYTFDDFKIYDYKYHTKIKMDMVV